MSSAASSPELERDRRRARDASAAHAAMSRGVGALLAVALAWMFVASLPSRSPALQPEHAALRLNPNTAAKAELMLLPGIGPALADNIVAYRQSAEGVAFTTADDLDNVHRIGPVTVDRMRGMLIFDAAEDPPR